MNKKLTTRKLIQENINNGTDFEFYPTTREIIEAMYWDMNGPLKSEKDYRAEALKVSLLDIGAGNCKLYEIFKEIAESQPMLEQYYYHPINDVEYYSKCIPLKIIDRINSRDLRVIFKDENNEEFEKELLMDEFMIMLKNTTIESIDFSSLDWQHERLDRTEK